MTLKQIEDFLGDDVPAAKLTAMKADHICQRDNMKITGFILTDEKGSIGIVDKSAVRWLEKDEFWCLMHMEGGTTFTKPQ